MIQVITRLRIVDLINTQIKAKPAAGRLLLGLNVQGTIQLNARPENIANPDRINKIVRMEHILHKDQQIAMHVLQDTAVQEEL